MKFLGQQHSLFSLHRLLFLARSGFSTYRFTQKQIKKYSVPKKCCMSWRTHDVVMASLCCECGREGWSERQKDVSKDRQKGDERKNPTCKHSLSASLAKTTLSSTTSDKMCYDDWEELSVMFEINIQMRIRFSSQDWDILKILCFSLFEQQHDLFQLQKQLSFLHKMCLLFVDEHFPLCWLKRMTTTTSRV